MDIRAGDDRRREGIVPGSIHIPRTVLEWRVDPASRWRNPYLPGPDGRLILLCDHGYSSALAAATLAELGVARVADVVGGFEAWRAAGLPVRECPAVPPNGLRGSGPPDRLRQRAAACQRPSASRSPSSESPKHAVSSGSVERRLATCPAATTASARRGAVHGVVDAGSSSRWCVVVTSASPGSSVDESVERREQRLTPGEIEPRARLVEQQQARPRHEGPRDQAARPLPVRAVGEPALREPLETEELEQLAGPLELGAVRRSSK